ncbi:unnamed protein product [Nippostrongylus brasiliensis]|uniref:Uncharacterized protein n=1 Tax=Nippostrongylus brasiliensis TaxID=27835 RepID=A0A0N4XI83_NIPBR|nr:unnamed protein product [Nippostrongylus brasiliensis]
MAESQNSEQCRGGGKGTSVGSTSTITAGETPTGSP